MKTQSSVAEIVFGIWLLQLGAYREIYRVLKPGQYFALDELCLTDKFDPNNAKHRDLKAKIVHPGYERSWIRGVVLKPSGYGFNETDLGQITLGYIAK